MNTEFFTLPDLISAFLWLIIIIVIGFVIRSSNDDKPHYKYFMQNLYAKLIFSLGFAIIYIFIYGGGDTTAYFDGAMSLNNLFLKSPSLYFEELTSTPSRENFRAFYDQSTGFPPGWIYREPESFFTCKLISLFSFLSFKSYFALTFIMAFISTMVSWRLFELIRSFNFHKDRTLVFAILLLPSLNFWCSGISKDTITFLALAILIINSFKILIYKEVSVGIVLKLLLAGFVIYHSRSFLLIVILIAFVFVITTRIVQYFGGGSLLTSITRSLVVIVSIAILGGNIINQTEAELLESSELIQKASTTEKDFKSNESYGKNKYDIGEIEFSPVGLVRAAPNSMIAGIYRPFIWESFSPKLIINAIESIVLFYLTLLFVFKSPVAKYRYIRNNQFLIFCLILVLTMAFITGLTSVIFGVLVRLRAPLIPFFIILLTIQPKFEKTKDKEIS